jgi:hypothetical protein
MVKVKPFFKCEFALRKVSALTDRNHDGRMTNNSLVTEQLIEISEKVQKSLITPLSAGGRYVIKRA